MGLLTLALRSSTMRSLLPVLAFLLASLTNAQQISITAGSATSCSGVIEDSGGPNGSYSDNENFTLTICPDVPGNVIYLNWFVFNLSNQGGPGNPADNITIYDGDNTSATSLGSYSGSALQNLIVSGTVFNTSGCLTLVFRSNNGGIGDFAAGFQCTVPCLNPTSVATMTEAAPALICQGEAVTFDGTGSTAQNDFNIVQYLWDWDDGTVDSTSGPIATHVFDDDGEHVVQLYVTDDNDCRNLNLTDLQILVSTTPTFSPTDESLETCFGETVEIFGGALPTTWTGIPDANFGEGIFLPDDVGLPFTSTLTFEQFDFGQLVTSLTDIESICVEMEHTFMGDLVLQVICPNGQSMIFHQQGGGGTYLGSPNDLDSNDDPIFGECWEYCWSPTATNGTWVENVDAGGMTTPSGTPQSGSMNPGTYEPVQTFNNLIGCPLNGDWTYQSTDLWGADNGFICSWSMNFNPDIIPDVTTFTPSFGPDADSSAWTGGTTPDLISANGDTITFTATVPGEYPFVYSVTDNFGCTYDTTITLTVNEPFVLDAGDDVVMCSDSIQLQATVVGASTPCEWTLQMDDSAFDGWNGASLTITVDGVETDYTMPFGGTATEPIAVVAGDAITLTYTAGFWESEVSYALLDDQGNVLFSDGPNPGTGVVWNGTASCDGADGMVWSWSPVEGLSDPTVPDPMVYITSPTMYVVNTHIIGHPICNALDSVFVDIDPGLNPGLDSLVILCATPPSYQLIDPLAGTPDDGGVWTNANGDVVPSVFDPQVDPAGVYTYTLETPLGCTGTADVEIQILPASDPSCCGVADAGPDSTICTLLYQLNATPGNTDVGEWSGPAGYVFDNAQDPQTNVTAPDSGPAMFYWTEDDGVLCYLIDSVTITFTRPLMATTVLSDAICFEACDGTALVSVTGGNGDFTYTWSDTTLADTSYIETFCAGDHGVTITDENGCFTSTEFTISQPVLLQIDSVSHVLPWCHGDENGSISIYDPEAVEYSFDGGVTFTTSNLAEELGTGLYDLQIRNAAGCVGTLAYNLPEPPQVIAEFIHGPDPANVEAPTITFGNLSQNSIAWAWDIAGLATSDALHPQYTFTNKVPDTYEVCLIARDANACADTICHTVIINDVLYTYIPNAFTPDGDGENEGWNVHFNVPDVTGFDLKVYDRWGKVVFAATDPNIRWNGTLNNGGGDILKQDVYAYRVVYQVKSTGGGREYLGHVSLLK